MLNNTSFWFLCGFLHPSEWLACKCYCHHFAPENLRYQIIKSSEGPQSPALGEDFTEHRFGRVFHKCEELETLTELWGPEKRCCVWNLLYPGWTCLWFEVQNFWLDLGMYVTPMMLLLTHPPNSTDHALDALMVRALSQGRKDWGLGPSSARKSSNSILSLSRNYTITVAQEELTSLQLSAQGLLSWGQAQLAQCILLKREEF